MITLTLIFISLDGFGQLRFSEVMEKLMEAGPDSIIYLDTEEFINDYGYSNHLERLKRKYPELKVEDGRWVIHRALWLSFRKGTLVLDHLYFKRGVYIRAGEGTQFVSAGEMPTGTFNYRSEDIVENPNKTPDGRNFFHIENCVFEGHFSLMNSKTTEGHHEFNRSRFLGNFLLNTSSPFSNNISLTECEFLVKGSESDSLVLAPAIEPSGRIPVKVGYGGEYSLHGHKQPVETVFRITGYASSVGVTNSTFSGRKESGLAAVLDIQSDVLLMDNNKFEVMLDLNGVSTGFLRLKDNSFIQPVLITHTIFPQEVGQMVLDWRQLSGGLLSSTYFEGGQLNVYQPQQYFYDSGDLDEADNNLTKSYQKLLAFYRASGDLRSYNGCFSEMKDVHGERSFQLFKTSPSFRNFFNWVLNRLLKVYSNHGTDPALSMTGSFFVIILFSCLYFMFPSQWDKTQKKVVWRSLMEKYRTSGRFPFRKFFKAFLSVCKSYLNAVMLSLNAFTTLGFGNIPTVGMARYLCIIEGFIGWFLLSIFTVAIFNQVSF